MPLDRSSDDPASSAVTTPKGQVHSTAEATKSAREKLALDAISADDEAGLSAVTPLPPPVPLGAQPPVATPAVVTVNPAAATPAKAAPPANVPVALEAPGAPAAPNPLRASQPRIPGPRPPPPAAFVVELPPAGDLSFFDAPRIVGWAVATGYSGCLWLAPSAPFAPPLNALSEDTTPHRELYLENGGLIGAFSTLPSDSLVDYLIPLWSRPQAQRARAVTAEIPPAQPREQLSALVAAGLLKRASATAHLASYVHTLCCRALSPSPGRYRVLPRALTNNQRIEPPLPLRRLLVEGLRKGASLEFLQQRLGPPITCLRPTAVIGATEGGAALVDTGLSGAEEVALACFNGHYTLADIARRSRIAEHAVYVLGYALLCLGAAAVPRLTPRAIPRPRPLVPPMAAPEKPERPATVEKSAAPRPSAGDAEAAMRRVQQKFRQVEEGDYFTLLELPTTAGTDDVLRAHQTLRAEFFPPSLPYRCRSSMDRELRQIARALDEARLILSNEASRRIYGERLIPRP